MLALSGMKTRFRSQIMDMNIQNIGKRLRRLRKAKGLTMRELSGMVGCSESLLSKIETDKVDPSLKTLHNITTALGVSISALFSEPEPTRVVYRSKERPQLRMPAKTHGGGVVLERIIPHTPDHMLECNIHIIAPGDGSDGSIGHEGEEVGYVLEGQVELVVDGASYLLSPGDAFAFRSELPHSYMNKGTVTARILWTNTPPTF